MLDSLIKIGSSALLGSALGPAAPLVSSILGKAVSGQGSSAPSVGSLVDPFKSLFGQAAVQVATPFRPIPATFQSPSLNGTVGQFLGSLGDVAGKKAAALEKLKSTDPAQQLAGMLEFQEIQRQLDLAAQVADVENKSKQNIISKIS